jgi:Gram-negative bacterial TonB protein C-terminal
MNKNGIAFTPKHNLKASKKKDKNAMKNSISNRFILRLQLIAVLSFIICEAFAQTDIPPPILPKIDIPILKDTITDKPVYLMNTADPLTRFEGGYRGFMIFVMENLRYRKRNLKCGECIVKVSFNVTAKGEVIVIKVVKGLSRKFNKEAIRVLKLTKGKWKASNQNDNTESRIYTMPFEFKIG